MVIQTTRFGQVPIQESDIITFKEGILGFAELSQFVLLDDPNDEIFAWLQSCQNPGIAFPVLEPELFSEKFSPTITKGDLQNIEIANRESAKLLAIVTIPEDVTQMTANLKAHIALNLQKRLGKQVVVQENDLPIKHPIFMDLQKRYVQNPQGSLKGQGIHHDYAVKISDPKASVELNA